VQTARAPAGAVQARSQLPQWAIEDCGFTHAPPQSVVAVLGHSHRPARQRWPGGHASPQAPQFVTSRETSTQRSDGPDPHRIPEAHPQRPF
jgi:hypothetical protein